MRDLAGGMSVNIKYTVALQRTIENCSACVNVHKIACDLKVNVWSVINNDVDIYSIGLVKAVSESLQELVRASSSSMLVTLNNV